MIPSTLVDRAEHVNPGYTKTEGYCSYIFKSWVFELLVIFVSFLWDDRRSGIYLSIRSDDLDHDSGGSFALTSPTCEFILAGAWKEFAAAPVSSGFYVARRASVRHLGAGKESGGCRQEYHTWRRFPGFSYAATMFRTVDSAYHVHGRLKFRTCRYY